MIQLIIILSFSNESDGRNAKTLVIRINTKNTMNKVFPKFDTHLILRSAKAVRHARSNEIWAYGRISIAG
jgi:hypothetical protein